MKDTHNTCIRVIFFLPFCLSAFLLFIACSNDAYETGDTKYSYLRADFVEATTDAQSRLVSAVTDDGQSLSFSAPLTASWATVADTTYRALLYYNVSSTPTVEPVTAGRVYVLVPKPQPSTLNPQSSNLNSQSSNLNSQSKIDPVHFQSAWVSGNKWYANLSLALMTGVADSIDERQSLGLVCDSITVGSDGHRTYHCVLAHSQGDVPQYYKTTVYVSIPTKTMTVGDCVRLSLNTYEGWIIKEFAL